jgi:hypothetical protein
VEKSFQKNPRWRMNPFKSDLVNSATILDFSKTISQTQKKNCNNTKKNQSMQKILFCSILDLNAILS